MSVRDEYRQFAEESLRWARNAKSEDERKALLDMARIWANAAANLTPGEAILPGIAIQAPGADPDTMQ